jgi:activator of HSP90 ATPase
MLVMVMGFDKRYKYRKIPKDQLNINRDEYLWTMKEFKKYYLIAAKPEEVYLALTTPITIQLWSGEEAVMSTEVNTEFSLWEGSISGKNLEFEKDKKIVQQWYFGEQSEPSIVTIKLHPHDKGTSLEVRQSNIPDQDYDDIVDGWDNIYMASLQDFYEA